MEPDEAKSMMGGVPGLESWERESPGEVTVGTDKAINDWTTREEHMAMSSEADIRYLRAMTLTLRIIGSFLLRKSPARCRAILLRPLKMLIVGLILGLRHGLEDLQLPGGPGRQLCLPFLLQFLLAQLWIKVVLRGVRSRCHQGSLRLHTLVKRAVKH